MSESASLRESGILWAPQIPSDWDVKPFAAAFQETRKRNTGMVEHNLLSLSFGRIVRKPINTETGLLPESFETYQIVEPDTLVFRFTDLQNDQKSLRTARVTERGIITSAYGAATPIGLDARFADYLMRSYDTTKVFYSFGGGVRQSLKLRDIARMPVIAPPNSIQRMIADYLDRETAQIDTLIAKQEQLIIVLRERRQSQITTALAKGSWPERRVKDLATVINGFPFDASSFLDAGGTPLVRIRDLLGSEYKTFVPEHSVPPEALIHDGDIVIGMDGDFNSVLWSRGSAALNQRLCLLRAGPEAVSPYVAYAMPEPLKIINDLTYSTTVKHLSSKQVADIRIPLPPLEEQRRIVAYLDEQTAKIDALIAKAERFIELAKERRAALITAAVTGQLDVTAA